MNTKIAWNRIFAVLLALGLALPLCAARASAADVAFQEACRMTGEYLEGQTLAVGSEWAAIGLIRSGRTLSADYGTLLTDYVSATADENGRLHQSKSTETSRVILALTAMGVDASDVNGHDLIAGIGSLDYVKKQGVNGLVWALLALDSGNYTVPAGGDVTRESLIQSILDAERPNGGWAVTGSYADPDVTAMVLQALVPYCAQRGDIRAAVDRAVSVLSAMQKEDGGFATFGQSTSESIAQVIMALSTLGIDPAADERFVKNGISAVDALLEFYVEGGGFRHVMSDGINGLASAQAYCALVAYDRFLTGKSGLYLMGEAPTLEENTEPSPEPTTPQPTETQSPIPEPTEPPAPVTPEPAVTEEPASQPAATPEPTQPEASAPAAAEPTPEASPAHSGPEVPEETDSTVIGPTEGPDKTTEGHNGLIAVGAAVVICCGAAAIAVVRRRSGKK